MLMFANVFSVNMLQLYATRTIKFESISEQQARDLLTGVSAWESIIGHPDTAAQLSELLGLPVAVNRSTVTLGTHFMLLVAQYRGPRLPEGTVKLPVGARYEFVLITPEEQS